MCQRKLVSVLWLPDVLRAFRWGKKKANIEEKGAPYECENVDPTFAQADVKMNTLLFLISLISLAGPTSDASKDNH